MRDIRKYDVFQLADRLVLDIDTEYENVRMMLTKLLAAVGGKRLAVLPENRQSSIQKVVIQR